MLRNQISLQGFTSLCVPSLRLIPPFTQAGSFSSVHWMLASYLISDRVLLILPLPSVFSLQPDPHAIHAKIVSHLGCYNASYLDFLAPSACPSLPLLPQQLLWHIHIIHVSLTDVPNVEVSSCRVLVSNLPLTPHPL